MLNSAEPVGDLSNSAVPAPSQSWQERIALTERRDAEARTLQVRAAALEAALRHLPEASAADVVAAAKRFAGYLEGGE